MNTATPEPSYLADAIAEGYVFECACGELYSSVHAAVRCRKCRNYCVFGYCTHVTDIRTREVVCGEKPSQEEYEAQCKVASERWAEEKAEMELQIQMWREEGELYEAEMRRRREEEDQRRRDEEEDAMWDLQDELELH